MRLKRRSRLRRRRRRRRSRRCRRRRCWRRRCRRRQRRRPHGASSDGAGSDGAGGHSSVEPCTPRLCAMEWATVIRWRSTANCCGGGGSADGRQGTNEAEPCGRPGAMVTPKHARRRFGGFRVRAAEECILDCTCPFWWLLAFIACSSIPPQFARDIQTWERS